MTDVRPVTTRQDRRRFIDLPYAMYRHHPHWIPPLRYLERQRFDAGHPFYEHADVQLFLAWRNGQPVGRIAAIDDAAHDALHHDNLAAFGYFEAEDAAAAAALLDAAEAWARARGRRRLRGPLNPSLNESAGLLVDGFDDDPMILMPYNPPEYVDYLTRAGYGKIKDLYAWLSLPRARWDDRTEALLERVGSRCGATIHTIDMRRFDQEFAHLLDIYAATWSHNWGFVPPTDREAHHTIKSLRQLVDPRLILCAVIDGKTVGFVVAVPDLNQVLKGTRGRLFPWGALRLLARKHLVDRYRLLLLGVLPEYRGSGLYALLAWELNRRLNGIGCRRLELSWILEDNLDINQPLAGLGLRRYKTYRLYQKEL